MFIIEIIKAIALGIIQGVTEWLPISSTGHMLLFDEFFKLDVSDEFFKVFTVVIQLGSIMAVVLMYFKRLNPFSPRKTIVEKRETWAMWFKIIVAIIPLGIVGVLFEDAIDALFYDNIVVIAIALIVYGIAFIVMEQRRRRPRIRSIANISYLDAFLIGCFQVLSVVPGTSRSGSTILGATLIGTERKTAAEFSFFMAIPVMFGASLLKIIKVGVAFTLQEIVILLVGCLVAFVVSVVVIKFLMAYIRKHDFKIFGYYRIVLGIIILIYFYFLK